MPLVFSIYLSVDIELSWFRGDFACRKFQSYYTYEKGGKNYVVQQVQY